MSIYCLIFCFIVDLAAKGQYFVSLPDGRLQTVTYTADGNGYIADVQYSGTPIVVVTKPAYSP